MAGKRRAKFEKKALPRVETAEKSRMAGKRLAKNGEKGATESQTRIFFASGGACGGLRCQ